jgi:radical SAM superfamily enzyme YgiQ (UPF0313 family)
MNAGHTQALAKLTLPENMQGNEKGSIHKPWEQASLRVCLCHPDRYEAAAGSAAVNLLYQLINRRPAWLAERAFLLTPEWRENFRSSGLTQVSLESKHPVSAFDLVGISMPTELLYPNLAQFLLDSGLSPWASRRKENDPLIAAGGVASFNPLPIAPLVDLVFVGEAEESLPEALALLERERHASKLEKLAQLARVPGVYVPRIHQNEMQVVSKRALRDLSLLTELTEPIIPYGSEGVHRASLQLMRGCVWKCRYCQAGFTTLPVRSLPAEQVAQTVQALRSHGVNEVSLLALNAIDYPHMQTLVALIKDSADDVRVPAIKMDRVEPELVRPLGNLIFSHALEAGTQRLRLAINRPYRDADSSRAIEHILKLGGQEIYLDFMIGLPTETDDDVIGIAHTVKSIAGQTQGKAKLSVSVAPFVPKPHTPLQWHRQLTPPELRRRLALIEAHALKTTDIIYRYRDTEPSVMEGVFARGDEQVAKLIVKAAEAGVAAMDWPVRFQESLWTALARDCGLNLYDILQHPNLLQDALPWEVINVGVQKKYLLREWEKTLTA